MPRRLLPLAALVLAVALGAGCAEDVSPAAQVGDTITISNTDLMDEVETWADSPGMVSGLEMGDPAGPGPGSFATSFVNGVLGFRIGFELHNEQFDALGLELTPEEVDQVRSGIFGTESEQVLEELGEEYADQLVMDVARQFAVQQAMGEEYQPWLVDTVLHHRRRGEPALRLVGQGDRHGGAAGGADQPADHGPARRALIA